MRGWAVGCGFLHRSPQGESPLARAASEKELKCTEKKKPKADEWRPERRRLVCAGGESRSAASASFNGELECPRQQKKNNNNQEARVCFKNKQTSTQTDERTHARTDTRAPPALERELTAMLTLKLWTIRRSGAEDSIHPGGLLADTSAGRRRRKKNEPRGAHAPRPTRPGCKKRSVSYLENGIHAGRVNSVYVYERGRTHISSLCVCVGGCESEERARREDGGGALARTCVSPTADVGETAAPRNEHKP